MKKNRYSKKLYLKFFIWSLVNRKSLSFYFLNYFVDMNFYLIALSIYKSKNILNYFLSFIIPAIKSKQKDDWLRFSSWNVWLTLSQLSIKNKSHLITLIKNWIIKNTDFLKFFCFVCLFCNLIPKLTFSSRSKRQK